MAKSTENMANGGTVHYVSARKKRGRPKPKMQPPLTPMIDVTFQLLLFFLLTFTFREAEGQIPSRLPIGDITKGHDVKIDPIFVVIRPAGDQAIYEMSGINVGIHGPEELYRTLMGRQRALGSKEVPVVIKPRGDVAWQHVVEAFNQAIRAKFKNIGFAPST
ncbi:MAG: biopolymer transporter ExbD [Planctomycetota bacterium]|nr:biopolymer transporter ExbD [Planctomycetota bacterium]